MNLPKVKKVFIRSGIRYDYLLAAKDNFLQELCEHHVSGQLKVAPEHVSSEVTTLMGKPGKDVYIKFAESFKKMNENGDDKLLMNDVFDDENLEEWN